MFHMSLLFAMSDADLGPCEFMSIHHICVCAALGRLIRGHGIV